MDPWQRLCRTRALMLAASVHTAGAAFLPALPRSASSGSLPPLEASLGLTASAPPKPRHAPVIAAMPAATAAAAAAAAAATTPASHLIMIAAQKAMKFMLGSFGMSALAAMAAVFVAALKFYGLPTRWFRDQPALQAAESASFTASKFKMTAQEHVVKRAAVDAQLRAYLARGAGTYALVVGPSGSGKSDAVKFALHERQGVVQIIVSETLSVGSLYSKVLTLAGLGQLSSTTDLYEQLAPFMRTAIRLYRTTNPEDKDWLPTVLVDIADGTLWYVARSALKIVKMLTVDERVARAVLVVSDPSIVCVLPDEPDRQELVWVGDMSDGEAREYLDSMRLLRPADAPDYGELRASVLGEVGTRASSLRRLSDLLKNSTNATATVQQFVERRRAAARSAVDALLAVDTMESDAASERTGMRFRRLLTQLLESPFRSVPREEAPYMAPPAAVMAVLARREHDALVYDPSGRCYRFNTRAHERAAQAALARSTAVDQAA